MAINKMANALAILECLGQRYKTTENIAASLGKHKSAITLGLNELERRGLVRKSSSYKGDQLPWVATKAAKTAIFLMKERGSVDSFWRGKMYQDQQRKLFGQRLHLRVDIDGSHLIVMSEAKHSRGKRELFLDLKRL